MTTIILVISLLLQCLAAFLSLRLVRVTEQRIMWLAVSTVIIGFAIACGFVLYEISVAGLRLPDGHVVETGFLCMSLVFLSGVIVGCRGAGLETTKIENRERELWESRMRLVNAQKMARMGSWRYEVSSGELVCSEEILNIYGVPPGGNPGMSLETVVRTIHPDDRERIKNELNTIVETGVSISTEFRIIRSDGEQRMLTSRREPVMDEKGRVVAIEGITQDITELKNSQKNLQRFSRIFEESLNEIYFFRPDDFRITEVNQAVIENLGYSRSELKKLTPADLVSEFCMDELRDIVSPVLEGEKNSIVFESRHRKKNGSFYDVEIHIQLFRDDYEELLVAIIVDITERKMLEKQLLQSQKMEAVGQLTGGIAHDFNNILQSVLGYSQLALGRARLTGDEKLLAFMKEIVNGGERADQLVSKMLAFSRSEVEQARVVRATRYVQNAVALLKGSLPSTIELQVEIAPALPAIRIDPIQLEQMVMNLGINARDAMQGMGVLDIRVAPVVASDISGRVPGQMAVTGGRRLDVCHCRSGKDSHTGNYLVLSVKDTGNGISDEVLEHLFEPFYSTKSKAEGAGMGLAMIHGIMKSLGGHIIVESSEKNGSIFSLVFEAAPTQKKGAVQVQPAIVSTDQESDGRVLLVDDETAVLEFMSVLLSESGYLVEKTDNIDVALDLFETCPQKYDLALLDNLMPGMTGLELAEEILAIRPDLPIILCSGVDELIDENSFKNVGVRACLKKPASASQLLDLVAGLLDEAA